MAAGGNPWTGFTKVLSQAITALKPHGATPIVAVTLCGLGLMALAVGAPPIPTVGLVLLSFGAYFFGQERQASWDRARLELEYDALEKRDARAVRRRLERRLDRLRKPNEPTPSDAEEAER